jgi:mRNA interferase YafQ
MEILHEALDILIDTGSLPAKYRPHLLSGNHEGEWEAHLKGDWLLVWKLCKDELVLMMLGTGTHSDLLD